MTLSATCFAALLLSCWAFGYCVGHRHAVRTWRPLFWQAMHVASDGGQLVADTLSPSWDEGAQRRAVAHGHALRRLVRLMNHTVVKQSVIPGDSDAD